MLLFNLLTSLKIEITAIEACIFFKSLSKIELTKNNLFFLFILTKILNFFFNLKIFLI